MTTYPILYKKTNTGAIQYWQICVLEDSDHSTAYDIQTEYGQIGTTSPQLTFDTIYEGKNIGKKNETTVYQQAKAEALAKWEKQKKKGYVESIEAAQAGETDALIEGGIVPMLAHKFSEQSHKIKYPAFSQPKLDGIRCLAVVKDGTCTLWSRTRKQITSMPHIVEEVEKVFGGSDIVLDGELYNHDFRDDFEKIVSAVRKDKPEDGYDNVEYHIYDLAIEGTFAERIETLVTKLHMYEKSVALLEYLVPVATGKVEKEEDVSDFFEECRFHGYEGIMLRNADSKYENKRSYNLQKVKEFDDAEFDIIGVEEGRGKLAGHAIFICKMSNGKEFFAKMKGDTAMLKRYFDNHSLWQGKKLNVQYQGLTGREGVPRFPVGIYIREHD